MVYLSQIEFRSCSEHLIDTGRIPSLSRFFLFICGSLQSFLTSMMIHSSLTFWSVKKLLFILFLWTCWNISWATVLSLSMLLGYLVCWKLWIELKNHISNTFRSVILGGWKTILISRPLDWKATTNDVSLGGTWGQALYCWILIGMWRRYPGYFYCIYGRPSQLKISCRHWQLLTQLP